VLVDGIVDSFFVFAGWEGIELRRDERSWTSPNQDDSNHSIVSERKVRKIINFDFACLL
jgi:hypothetical protein